MMPAMVGRMTKVSTDLRRRLNGKDVVFAVPPKTGNGTIFRFKGGGRDGRDLHLEVQAVVDTKDGGN